MKPLQPSKLSAPFPFALSILASSEYFNFILRFLARSRVRKSYTEPMVEPTVPYSPCMLFERNIII